MPPKTREQRGCDTAQPSATPAASRASAVIGINAVASLAIDNKRRMPNSHPASPLTPQTIDTAAAVAATLRKSPDGLSVFTPGSDQFHHAIDDLRDGHA